MPQFGAGKLERRPDEFGGYASTHIVVKLKSSTENGLAAFRTLFRTGRDVDPRPWLSPQFQRLTGSWRATLMRPFRSETFGDPNLAAKHGLDRTYVIEVPPGTDTPAMARSLAALSDEVEVAGLDGIGGVAADQLIPNDTNFGLQYAMDNTGQTGGTPDADIDAVEAWAIHTGDPGTVTIAIIDSGVSPHTEFGSRLIAGHNTDNVFTPTLTTDGCPHGTHVAGIAAATGNNSLGIAGITWGANIMPVRVLNGCSGFVSSVANGIIWAADHGANVGNMSLQFYGLSASDRQLFQNALDYAHDRGMAMFCAAGNDNQGGSGVVAYPARLHNCLAVSATTDQDLFADVGTSTTGWRSNYGPQVEISAPGDRIYSTLPSNSFAFLSGTSMATPHVTGVAALLKSYDPTLTNDDLRDLIIANVDDKGPFGWDDHYGYGRLNAYNAIVSADSWPSITASDPPNRAIDARIPFDLDGTNPQGWYIVDLTVATDATALAPVDFLVYRHGASGGTPFVSTIEATGPNTVTVTLNVYIKVQAWTTLQYHTTGLVRLGYLPGDVNGNATSDASDVTALVDYLGGVGDPLPEWSSDIDRSNATTPLDILTEIDLLNGAGSYNPFLNASLP
ncbi:MAG: S8 family serine peptidase [Planctomycetes bacterium]|nr:S8 family serine peptidase [Planctomycetota bacterium]